MNIPAKKASDAATIENVLVRGDLKDLSEQQRTEYYLQVCKSLGLNPSTRPFDYLTLNGKLQLYARRDAADQLRKINGISIEVISRVHDGDLFTVHVRAKDRDGRTDEDFGVVAFRGGATEIAANSVMKAVTKAKRRVTLSISGLGFLDETEIPTKREQALLVEDEEPSDTVEPHQLSVAKLPNNAGTNWRKFGEDLRDVLRACETKAEVFEWLEKNKTLLNEMGEHVPTMYNNLQTTIEEIKAEPT